MCEPTTLVMIGTAVAGAISAKVQSDGANATYADNAKAANVAAANDYSQVGLRQQQELDAASQQLGANRKEALQKRSDITTASAERGLSGASISRMLSGVSFDEGTNNTTIKANASDASNSLQNQMIGINANAQSRINSVEQGKGINFGALAIGLGKAGLNYQQNTAAQKAVLPTAPKKVSK